MKAGAHRYLTVALAAALLCVSPVPVLANHPPEPWEQHRRLYLMGATTQYTYWSVDATDPELDARSIVQHCGTTEYWRELTHQRPCFGTATAEGDPAWDTYFLPGSLFETPPVWSAAAPLRFHIEVDVDTLVGGHSVGIVLQRGKIRVESAPGVEVAPGVWEGTLATAPPSTGLADLFGVRVIADTTRVVSEIHLRGRSWIEFPEPVGAKGVPELVTEDTHRPAPGSFASATRSFTFNDDAWQTWSFQGDLAQTRSFPLTMPRDAATVLVWVEAYDAPFVQRMVRGLEADPRTLTDGVTARLLRGGQQINGSGSVAFGQGVMSFAVSSLEAGPLTVQVEGPSQTDEPLDYRAHLLAVYGTRTLGSMRWSVPGQHSLRALVGVCPGAYEPVPFTSEVRSALVDIDWDTEAVGADPAWTLRWDIPDAWFPCGEMGVGDRIRFTMPGERVSYVGATPPNGLQASAYDTTFDYEVRYTYSPPPHVD